MCSVDLAMTTAAVFAFSGATLHAQNCQMPADNQHCPSQWGDAESIAIPGGNAAELMKLAA